jgi:hypothetical protein
MVVSNETGILLLDVPAAFHDYTIRAGLAFIVAQFT